MSAPIKRYQMWEAAYALALDTEVVLCSDHLAAMAAASAYDEEKERELFEAAIRVEVGEEPSVLYRRDSKHSLRLGQYVNESIESFWLGWVMCAKSRAKIAVCE